MPKNPTHFSLILASFFVGSLCAEVSYNQEIRPILSKNCIGCHGPDEAKREGDFRIDNFEGATHNNDGVIGIVPGKAAESEVYKRITHSEASEVMPPADHGHALKPEEIALIKQWINEGAKYEAHWAFVKPVKSQVPSGNFSSWTRNEIDAFIAQKHSERGLKSSPQADPYELIRRVSLDLTGMPPTLEEATAFAANPSAENYQKHVDKLLASPHFGEHWAAMWLDLARYADSVGYSGDEHRDIWPWRDWVIDAFNQNMPFDQFTIEQIAGDLLPNATDQQKLATAFNRNTLSNNEGGTNDEEFRVIAVKDRINTNVNVWMGLTMRCAECHTHKYDPITQKEYYAFYDYFNQSVDSDQRDDRPKIEVFPRGREKENAELAVKIAEAEKKILSSPDPWITPQPTPESRDGAKLTTLEDRSIDTSEKNPDYDQYSTRFTVDQGTLTGIRMELLPSDNNAGNIGRGSGDGACVVSHARLFDEKGSNGGTQFKFSEVVADHEQANMEAKYLIRDHFDDKKGWAMNHGREGYRGRREVVFMLDKPIEITKPQTFTFVMNHDSPYSTLNTARYRISYTFAKEPVPQYRKNTLDPLQREIRDLEKQRSQPIRVPVMQDRAAKSQRESHVMLRGSFRQLGEKVQAAVLNSFHPLPKDAPPNRLGVAKWIVSTENPLTARVAVNRFWARIFGIGIVETEEDFGMQSLTPTNQPLLDWLAVDFQENGWDTKALLKKMVMSAAYQQSAVASPEHLAKDSRNLYLARGPRVRLAAEVIRDQALAVSGILTDRTFGPPVYPPSPVKHIASAFTGGMTWIEDKDSDRYRRAIYTYLKRTSPHPLFDTFDMATREVCNMRRFRTNTPLQSFMTLNDVVFIEASQSLARKMLERSNGNIREAIKHGLEQTLAKPANDKQIDILEQLYIDTLGKYQNDLPSAKKMAGTNKIPATLQVNDANAAQLASLSVVANVMLNLDGFLTK